LLSFSVNNIMISKELLYAILAVCVLAVVGIGLVACSGEGAVVPSLEGQIVVKQSGGAAMLVAECADEAYRTEKADYIIEGTVEKVECKWNQGRVGIFTYTDLRIEKYVKGTPFAENKLQIVTSGGTVGEMSQWVEDQSIFHEGKRVRIYFEEVNGEFLIVCGQFGVEEPEPLAASAK
jgi:uncharacterized protein YodC (DUF2158 family)